MQAGDKEIKKFLNYILKEHFFCRYTPGSYTIESSAILTKEDLMAEWKKFKEGRK